MKDVKNLRAHLAWMGLACAGQQPEQDVKDKIALVELGSCGAPAKLASALAFGAVGVLAYQENTLIDQLDGQPKTDLPAFMISGQDALTLRDRLSDGEDLEAVLSYQWHESLDRTYLDDTISSFSSRGPSRLGVFKPNISGPGTNIHAPKMGSGDNGTVLSGTSMASPLVAGAAAVAVDRARSEGLAEADQPLGSSEGDLSAVDIASLLVNGADMTVWQDDNRNEQPVALARGGAGRVDLVDSAHLTTLLEADTSGDHPERTPYGISFGLPTFISPRNETAPFLLRNLSDHDRTYRLETSFIFEDDAASGVTLTPSEDTVDVPAGGTAQLNLDLDLDPAGMKRYTAYGGNAAMVASKLTDAEHDAYLVATEVDGAGAPVDGGDLVRLPVYVLPRAASALAFEGGEISVDADTGKGTGNVANAGQQPGRGELFVPVGEDDTEPNMKPGIDIDHVGVRLGRDVAGERTIEFLVHTRGPASVPLDRRAIVAIDVNRDGAMDWVVINEDNGRWPWNRYPRPNGNQVAVLTQVAQPRPLSVSVNPGIYKAEYFAGVDLESRAVILPVRASSLGFGDGDTIAFDIAVAVQDIFKDRLDGKTWSALDSAPDGAWDAAGLTGGAAYRFDESALDYSVGAWSFNVGPGTSFGVHVSLKGIDDGTPPSPLLAYFPLNGPDESRADDLAVVPVVVRSGPRPTSTPDTAGSRVFLPALKDEANP
jgi:hypothetical protein